MEKEKESRTATEEREELAALREQLSELEREAAEYRTRWEEADAARQELTRQLEASHAQFCSISESTVWKATWPIRYLLDGGKRMAAGWRTARERRRVQRQQEQRRRRDLREHRLRFPAMEAPEGHDIAGDMPTGEDNTPPLCILLPVQSMSRDDFLETLCALRDQSFPHWELYIWDGSDSSHRYLRRLGRRFAWKDRRIHYKRRPGKAALWQLARRAAGEYVAVVGEGKLLHPDALGYALSVLRTTEAELLYGDESRFQNTPGDGDMPHYRQGFAPDDLRAYNYIGRFFLFRRALLERIDREEEGAGGEYDLLLRLCEKTRRIFHIPRVLCYCREGEENGERERAENRRALKAHLKRTGLRGEVMDTPWPPLLRIRYELEGEPMISILIPSQDHGDDLAACVESICEKSSWRNYEILVIENNSRLPETFALYEALQGRHDNLRVLTWGDTFNFSAINNFAAREARGDYLLLLNNDMTVITPDWMQEMLMFAQRRDVGIVGAKLLYPNGTIQHGGMAFDKSHVARHLHRGVEGDQPGYEGRLRYAQNLSAVTGACVLLRRQVWEEVQGLDEGFQVMYNDVDLCMRLRERGYLVVWTPHAQLYHYESKSRGSDDTPEKRRRGEGEVERFLSRWDEVLEKGEPYYNPNLPQPCSAYPLE